MKPNKSKMESKLDIIRKHKTESFTEDGMVTVFDYPAAMDEWSNQQNATLIAEHKMMKDALEYIAYYDKNASGKKASEALKKLGR